MSHTISPLLTDAGFTEHDEPFLQALSRRARKVGLDGAASRADPLVLAAAAQGLADERASLRGAAAKQPAIGGWTYPKPNIGNFGTDYVYRAEITVAALAALPREEAMYMWAVGPGVPGAPPRTFDGRRAWRLDLPRPPLRDGGFWSLSLYEAAEDGGFYFTDNPLRRYAIGDRTPGLVSCPNGSISIRIGAEAPEGAGRANWLPAPAGPFALVMRTFLPDPELLDGRFRLPPVHLI